MTNGKCQRHLAAPRAIGLKNSLKSGKERNMREGTGRCYGEFCVLWSFSACSAFSAEQLQPD